MSSHPSRMTKDERLLEIAEIMAAAIVRLKNRKLRKNKHIPLDSSPERSVYDAHHGGEEP